jgi:hypothetical protein
LLDFEEEEGRVDQEMHWATQSDSEIASEVKRALRRLDDKKKDLDSSIQDQRDRKDHLLAIIEGRIKPAAVDLPEEQAADFKTKLRLRVKGVRGIAIEKAREDLPPVEEKIEGMERKAQGLEAKMEVTEERGAGASRDLTELIEAIKQQRILLRRASSLQREISGTISLFGWRNPYSLAEKCFQEGLIARRRLERQTFSLRMRKEEVADLTSRIQKVKGELKSTLGDAYEGSLIPIVFKEGRSPQGRRFMQDELTLSDVRSLDLVDKISHHKATGRKADRLSSVLLDHRTYISDSLLGIASLCQQRAYAERLARVTAAKERAANALLEEKMEVFHQILAVGESCRELGQLTRSYVEADREMGPVKERAVATLGEARSDL